MTRLRPEYRTVAVRKDQHAPELIAALRAALAAETGRPITAGGAIVQAVREALEKRKALP